MIIAYFTKNEKYLQKGDYKKDFSANSIAELISNIKVKEAVLIKANSKDIFDFKFNNNNFNIEGDFKFEILQSEEKNIEPIFNCELIQDDEEAGVAYGLYDVIGEKWQNKLGKQVYFCRNRELQLHLVREKDICTFLYDDMQDLVQSLQHTGEIPDILVAKMFVDDRELSRYDERGNLKDEFRS